MADLDDSDFEDDAPEPPKKSAGFVLPKTPEQKADEAMAIALEFVDVPMTTMQMANFIDTEQHRIEGEQRARLLAGMLVEPTAEQVERIARLQVIKKFLAACAERPGEAAEHFRRLAQRQREQ